MAYAPIHNHSEYSALDGLATCKEIAVRCEEIGVESVGITDHATVSGHLEFGKTMAEHGIKPIFGCELYHGVKTEWAKNERDQAHFITGAMTDEGLRNLWRLVDKASEKFRYVGRTNWEDLEAHSTGLFATSACIAGLVAQEVMQGETDALNRYLEIFRDNFYVELHTYPGAEHEALNHELVRLATERGIPMVYATDAHFASPEQYEVHDAFVAMQSGGTLYQPVEDRKMWHPKSLYIQNATEIKASLSYLPEAVVEEAMTNTGDLAAKCQANLPDIKRHLPMFVPSKSPWVEKENRQIDAAQLMLQEVEKGIEARYADGGTVPQEIWDRAATECEVFLKGGLEHYFLQAWDFVQFCEKEGIRRGPGRGSAAGSIVAYALGITDVDPLEFDLIFERFYNPGRAKGFPDIDSDFPTKDRERVKKYMEDRWGKDKVRSIGTITRMKPIAALDKTYKVCGIEYTRLAELKKIVKQVPDIEILGHDSIGWDEEIDPGKTIYVMHSTPHAEHDTGEQIKEWVKSIPDPERERIERWIELTRIFCSRISGYGIHPSGIVVSDVELADELPCMWNNNQKTQVTCFPMDDVDKRQFVKQDFLGLANLDILDDWEEQVTPIVGEIDWKAAKDDHDPNLWKLLEKGLTLGIFQIEDGYARHLCKEFKPKSIEELGIIVALNRPGPIRSGAPDSFIRRRNGDEPITYDHEMLEEILEPTYGWFLYQEQVIAFFSELGYDLSDADAVRKILGKKKPEEMQALYHGTGEWEGKGYLEIATPQLGKAAETIWKKIQDFAKYSFNKSHAIAYAMVGFRTLYAKFNSPAHFFISCIRVATLRKKSKEEGSGKYVGEARRMGIDVLPPNIDHSQHDIAMEGDSIYFGFSNIKGIGAGAAKFLCSLRDKYQLDSPEDVHDAIEAEQELWEEAKKAAKEAGKSFKKKSPRQNFPKNNIVSLHQVGAFADRHEESEFSLKELQKIQKELLGVIITDNCEAIMADHFEEIEECDSYATLEEEDTGRVYVPGIISRIDPKKTKKDKKPMGIVTIEYEGDQAEFVVFPQDWKAYRFLWSERTPAIFALSKTDRGIRFEDATKLT